MEALFSTKIDTLLFNFLLHHLSLEYSQEIPKYTTYLKAIASYGCNTLTTEGGDHNKLLVFESKISRKMHDPRR